MRRLSFPLILLLLCGIQALPINTGFLLTNTSLHPCTSPIFDHTPCSGPRVDTPCHLSLPCPVRSINNKTGGNGRKIDVYRIWESMKDPAPISIQVVTFVSPGSCLLISHHSCPVLISRTTCRWPTECSCKNFWIAFGPSPTTLIHACHRFRLVCGRSIKGYEGA